MPLLHHHILPLFCYHPLFLLRHFICPTTIQPPTPPPSIALILIPVSVPSQCHCTPHQMAGHCGPRAMDQLQLEQYPGENSHRQQQQFLSAEGRELANCHSPYHHAIENSFQLGLYSRIRRCRLVCRGMAVFCGAIRRLMVYNVVFDSVLWFLMGFCGGVFWRLGCLVVTLDDTWWHLMTLWHLMVFGCVCFAWWLLYTLYNYNYTT